MERLIFMYSAKARCSNFSSPSRPVSRHAYVDPSQKYGRFPKFVSGVAAAAGEKTKKRNKKSIDLFSPSSLFLAPHYPCGWLGLLAIRNQKQKTKISIISRNVALRGQSGGFDKVWGNGLIK